MTTNNNKFNRRTLLKGSIAGAALATTSSHINAQHKTNCSPNDKHQWDHDYDVVVVGSGTGLVGALVAAKAGKRVAIIEKSPAPGGNTVVSGGVFWIPNNNVMKREGLSDNPQDCWDYLQQLAQGQADDDIIEAFIEQGPSMVDFIETNTSLDFRVSKLMGEVADYHPEWQGSNGKGRSLEPVQPTVALAGGLLVSSLLNALQEAGAEILQSTPAKRLLVNEDSNGEKEVLGVQVEHKGKPINIRARQGVLMASGGYERNWKMKTHFLRGPSPYTLGAETNTGDGIHMGMAIGADLRNMNEVWGITAYKGDAEANGQLRGGISLAAQIERRNAGCIAVNRYGERFCNEAADYDSTWRSYHTWQNWGDLGFRNLPAYQIFDHNYREKYPLAGTTKDKPLPDWVIVADTLEQLAEKMGIDKVGLTATVTRFNQNAKKGNDPDFKRGDSSYDIYGSNDKSYTLAPLSEGPFYGAEITPADLGTCGGLRVNGKAQVIDVFNKPIKRLYASGNTAGVGSPGAMYGGGGGTIGPAMTFAYIGAKQIIKLS